MNLSIIATSKLANLSNLRAVSPIPTIVILIPSPNSDSLSLISDPQYAIPAPAIRANHPCIKKCTKSRIIVTKIT